MKNSNNSISLVFSNKLERKIKNKNKAFPLPYLFAYGYLDTFSISI
jgi:hypothetical protein